MSPWLSILHFIEEEATMQNSKFPGLSSQGELGGFRFGFPSDPMRFKFLHLCLPFFPSFSLLPGQLALRAGNEKEEGETADTVGCCSLRVEHINLHPELDGQEYVVEFDFLGKDSIRYYNKVPVEKRVSSGGLFFSSIHPFIHLAGVGWVLFVCSVHCWALEKMTWKRQERCSLVSRVPPFSSCPHLQPWCYLLRMRAISHSGIRQRMLWRCALTKNSIRVNLPRCCDDLIAFLYSWSRCTSVTCSFAQLLPSSWLNEKVALWPLDLWAWRWRGYCSLMVPPKYWPQPEICRVLHPRNPAP